ncbi:Putative conjugal transfer proteinc/MT3759 [Oceanobacillus picturae]|uniref:Conjugal transfer proteinc/MT3759 n=2 Tax=Oceanobacillus TaxID=182709 RepID=W9A8H1_9BACI|nr:MULTISPECIES: CpaF family protein [Oceanobacillus]CDO01793.1 Putative conjugal transfer proteinc/MT3759 [Oceanobacillus picturae]
METEKVIKELIQHLRETLDLMHSIKNDELREYVEAAVFDYASEHKLKSSEIKYLVERIYNAFRGYDVLQPLIDDRSITEIMVNNHKEVFIEKDGSTSQVDIQFESEQKLEDIIQAIVSKVDRVVNESSPIVDARLHDGSRVNVVLPPIALKGPVMTIRKFPEKPLMIEDLIEKNSISKEASEFLQKLVVSKYNIFIGGGTGSGKTTFLNVLSNFIPQDERIITIEDSAELQIKSVPNLVSLETRNANTEGKGEISIRDLIKSSLRMRPDRIIVGEVRGAEALDMLQAMNTGHDGSLSTGHANSTKDMLSRLETMVLSGASLPVEVIRQQISSSIDIMVHLMRLRDNTRKVVAISEVIGVENGEVLLNPLYEFVEEGETDTGKVIGELRATGNDLLNETKAQLAGISVNQERLSG